MNSQQPSEQNQPNQAENLDENLVTDRFPVVGIGASAGGVEAFRQLLSHLPTDTGMAFVLIQHLAPDHKSLLREILARETAMPTIEVRDRMAVEPNCVYVIPPNTRMTIERGLLKLAPREKNRATIKPVDSFFLSLAADLGSKAIVVVLSGGDGDGSRGLEAVKEGGGLTFAQSEDSAQVSSMPNTAVATGYVDFILTPQGIAQELAKISCHPYLASPPAEVAVLAEGESAMPAILTLLRTATGVNFSQYKHGTLNRRIQRRMVLYSLVNIDDYVTYLRGHSTEVQALYEDILIHVTSFFRDPSAFKTLQTKVFPTIANQGADVPIRIWVAGCSTGEEAYSIAICLLEYLDDQPIKPQIQIYATDISDRTIETARTGFYKSSAVSYVSPERLQRFFVPVDGGYQIGKSIREMCVFARQNLCSDPPFSKLDLISCRNVLIYLGAALQKKILPTFHYGLKPIGFLMLGSSETTGDSSDLFTTVDPKNKIYAPKLAPARLTLDLSANSYASEPVNPAPSDDPAWNDFDLQKEADRIVLEQFAPVGVVINNDLEILHFRGQTSLYLEAAPGRASFNLLKMAKDGLKLELRAAVYQARQQNLAVSKENLQIVDGKETLKLNLNVIPLKARDVEERYFLILFQAATPAAIPQSTGVILTQNADRTTPQPDSELEIARLSQELATTKEYLRSIIEEQEATNQDLRAANEEILSSNEEFQSSNEELETAKEEIQATNEELNTINDELQRRNHEATEVSNDLQNLISSTNIPTLMLSSDLCIRSFTPLAQSVLRLIPTDVGRPLRDINHALNVPDLESQIREVINTLKTIEQEVQDRDGHWYDLRIRPYRTLDDKIDGAMLILVDIDALKHSMEQLEYSRNYAQAIVETVREPLIVLDRNLRVFTANHSFYQTFQATTAETEQQLIFDLGNGQWNIPKLQQLLLEILPTDSELQDFEVEHDFKHIGNKMMLLNAWKMTQAEGGDHILLAIEDITERKQAEQILQRTAKFDAFRITLADALRPIIDPVEIQATASRVLGEYLGANRVVYFEIRGTDYVIERDYVNGATPLSGSYPLDSFSAKMLAAHRAGRTMSVSDLNVDPDLSSEQKAAYAAIQIGAHIDVPLVKGGEFIAGLAVHMSEPRAWTPDDVTLVEEVAERTWAALECTRAEAIVAANLRDTRLLRDLSVRLVNEDDTQTLYREILATAIALTHADGGLVRILDAGSQDFLLIGSQGFDLQMTEYLYRVDASSHTPCGLALRNSKPTFVDFDVPESEDPDGSMRLHFEAGYRSAQCTLLFSRTGKPLGMVTIHWRSCHRPSDRELRSLDLLARQAADLIEQQQTTAALRESEAKLRFMLDASRIGEWDLDLTTQPYTAHRSLIHDQIFGHDSLLPEWSYEIFLTYVHPEDRAAVDEKFQQTLTKGTEWNFECRIVHADSSIHWIWARSSVYYDASGTPTRLLGMVVDFTARKQMETALAERNQELDSFVYIVSHDLKAPLRAISNLSVWIEEDLGTELPAEIQQQMTQLRGRAQRMEGMIDGLLQYARVGRTDDQIQLISVAELLAEILDFLVPPSTFKIVIAPDLPTFHTKHLLLSQVFANLIGNAFKHHDKSNGFIRISSQEQGDFYEFTIVDDGPGIPQEQHDRVFIIFQSANPQKNPDSTGIGLSIVKKIVETAGGQIRLESELGKGTTFYFTWPKVM